MQLIPFDLTNKHHIKFMYDVRTHPEVAKNLLGIAPKNKTNHIEWLNKQIGIRFIFLIQETVNFYPTKKELIGYCHIYNIQDKSIEVGWALHPDFHNHGYGTQSVYQLIEKCKKEYPKKDIELYVKNNNIPAIIIYIKQGFIPVSIKDNIICMKLSYEKSE